MDVQPAVPFLQIKQEYIVYTLGLISTTTLIAVSNT